MATEQAARFAESYAALKAGVAKLRNAQVEDLDGILETVQGLAKAHQDCKARIEEIRRLVGEAVAAADGP